MGLCLLGAACLVLFGIIVIIQPSSIERLDESSTVALNGTGILIALSLLFMVLGIVLVLKKK